MTQSLLDRLSEVVGNAFEAEGLDAEYGRVQRSDRPDLAPFQCNGALAAAKREKKNPRALGEALASHLSGQEMFASIEVAGPGFLNLKVTDDVLATTVTRIGSDPLNGSWQRAENDREKVVIDYGGPNIAKPLHVGHLRSAIIGESMKRLFRLVGDEVLGDIHLGDWGLQMGQLITQLELEQPELPYFDETFAGPYPEQSPVTVDDLARLYPLASAASKSDEDYRSRAQAATSALQDGRPGYRALWRHFVDVSKAALERDYAELGVTFDLWKGEANVQDRISPLTDRLADQGLVEDSEGARVIFVAEETDRKKLNPVMMIKSNGSVGYHSTDMATIEERVEDYGAQRIVYVVDNRQSQHFEEVFRAAAKAGLIGLDHLEHTGFGTMNGTDGKPFKTREGGVLRLRDLIDTVVSEARARLAENDVGSDYDEDERADIAHKIGIAALKFGDLSNPRTSDYIFDPKRFVTFEGKTGPYLLYAVVRIRSVLAKAGEEIGSTAPIIITEDAERDLAHELAAYPEAVANAYAKRMPHILCDHAFALAQAFSKFYAACRIGDEADDATRSSRLRLARITADQLATVLKTLGLPVPDRM